MGSVLIWILVHLIVVGTGCPRASGEQKSAKVDPVVCAENVVVLYSTVDVHPDFLRYDPVQIGGGKWFYKVPVGRSVWCQITVKDIIGISIDKWWFQKLTSGVPCSHITFCYAFNVNCWGSPCIFGCCSYFQRFSYNKWLPVCVGLCLHQDVEPCPLTKNGLLVSGIEGNLRLPKAGLYSYRNAFIGGDNSIRLRSAIAHFLELVFKYPYSEAASKSQYERENSHPDCSNGGSTRSFITGCLILLFGFSLAHLAFYVVDEPDPPFLAKLLYFALNIFSAVCIGQAIFSL